MIELHPLLILAIGLLTVIGMILALRINAFIALLSAALVVSLLAPGEWASKVARVAEAFGSTAGGIGIVIALAAVIGLCLLGSGAADRIVRWFLSLLGEKRGHAALLSSGFVLSVPVFFDTVFYLLVPLARSMYGRTGRDYLKYLLAVAGGAAITHNLVPPTPGPLIMADTLGVEVGVMILVGAVVAIPVAIVCLFLIGWFNQRLDIPMRSIGDQDEPEPLPDDALPGLGVSLLPIILPVVLIASNTIVQTTAPDGALASWTAVLGNPNLALLFAAAISMVVYVRQRTPSKSEFGLLMEKALMSGGLIILITAAGGAFGAMLRAAEIGTSLENMFGDSEATGMLLLFLGFGVSSLLKIAQGSSTVAMITTSAMLASLLTSGTLSFHPVYLATAIGSGAMVGSWMNDSGFWIFAKMGGLTEAESLKTWTPLLALLGVAAFVVTLLMALVLPLT